MKFLPVFVSQLPILFYTRQVGDLLILATVVEGSPSVGYPVQQAKLHLLSTGAERKIKFDCLVPGRWGRGTTRNWVCLVLDGGQCEDNSVLSIG